MDGESSKSWYKLYNTTNETFLKIFKDKVSINNYKEVGEALKKEIALMKEQSENYSKANETLEKQVKQLKESYERKVQDLPFYSNVCARLKKQLVETEQRYLERETYLKEVIRSEQKKYDDLVEKSDAVWPECGQLKQEKADLEKLQLELKVLLQSIEDQHLKIRMKKDIQQKMFNSAIVDFVKKIKDRQENQKVIEEIERYTRDGNLLLKEYEKALANSEKRKMNEEFSQCDKILKFNKDDLPQIRKHQTLSPSPSTSSLLNLNSSKVAQSNAALEKYKEREMERKRRFQELTKQNLLYNSPSPYKKPMYEPKSQPPPQKTPIEKVQVLSQVFMPPANVKGKIETHTEPKEAKMPIFSGRAQFGNQRNKSEATRGFGKPQDVLTTLMQNKKFSSLNEPMKTPSAEEKFKGGQSSEKTPYTPFGGFSHGTKKEQEKPQKEKATEEPMLGVIEGKKPSLSGDEMFFDKEKSKFFTQSNLEEKKAPSPPKNISGDGVFKMPKTFDSTFDYNTYNQNASVDNDNTNMMEASYELPMCFSPSYENHGESEPMFDEKTNSPKHESLFLFQ